MAQFHLTNKAVNDLADICYYTVDTWSERQAENYYMLLIDSQNELAKKPSLGRKYIEVSSDVYGFVVYQDEIFFRVISKNETEITRILNVTMNLKNKI